MSQGQHKYPRLIYSENQHFLELSETTAIAHYLCQRLNKCTLNSEHSKFWAFSFYQHMSDASLMPLLLIKQVYQQTVVRTPWLVRWVSLGYQYGINRFYLNPELHQQLELIHQHLEHHDFIADQFSYADILLWFPLKACSYALPDFNQYQAITTYLARLASRPAFQSACRKGEFDEAKFKHYSGATQP